MICHHCLFFHIVKLIFSSIIALSLIRTSSSFIFILNKFELHICYQSWQDKHYFYFQWILPSVVILFCVPGQMITKSDSCQIQQCRWFGAWYSEGHQKQIFEKKGLFWGRHLSAIILHVGWIRFCLRFLFSRLHQMSTGSTLLGYFSSSVMQTIKEGAAVTKNEK